MPRQHRPDRFIRYLAPRSSLLAQPIHRRATSPLPSKQLVEGANSEVFQTLLGVTGSGKTTPWPT